MTDNDNRIQWREEDAGREWSLRMGGGMLLWLERKDGGEYEASAMDEDPETGLRHEVMDRLFDADGTESAQEKAILLLSGLTERDMEAAIRRSRAVRQAREALSI